MSGGCRGGHNSMFLMRNCYMYSHNSGINDIFVESEVNVAFRDFGDTQEKKFYDWVEFTDVDELFHADIIQPIKFTKSRPIKVRIQTEASKSGTATFQCGMLPVFPVIPTAVPKHWLESQIEVHAHASLDHSYPVFRDQTNQEKLDYSGCSPSGCNT